MYLCGQLVSFCLFYVHVCVFLRQHTLSHTGLYRCAQPRDGWKPHLFASERGARGNSGQSTHIHACHTHPRMPHTHSCARTRTHTLPMDYTDDYVDDDEQTEQTNRIDWDFLEIVTSGYQPGYYYKLNEELHQSLETGTSKWYEEANKACALGEIFANVTYLLKNIKRASTLCTQLCMMWHVCMHTWRTLWHACTHHAYMHTCIHAYMHTCIHAYMHTCIHAYMHTCIHAYMHAYIHARIRTHIFSRQRYADVDEL
jgi:hypothetical protein